LRARHRRARQSRRSSHPFRRSSCSPKPRRRTVPLPQWHRLPAFARGSSPLSQPSSLPLHSRGRAVLQAPVRQELAPDHPCWCFGISDPETARLPLLRYFSAEAAPPILSVIPSHLSDVALAKSEARNPAVLLCDHFPPAFSAASSSALISNWYGTPPRTRPSSFPSADRRTSVG